MPPPPTPVPAPAGPHSPACRRPAVAAGAGRAVIVAVVAVAAALALVARVAVVALAAVLLALAVAAGIRPGAAHAAGVQEDHPPGHAGHGGMAKGAAGVPDMDHAGAADGSMAHSHMEMGPHMKMTAPRPRTPEDQRRADALVETLRRAIGRYRDYRVAVADGYLQYLPNLPQPTCHFTNWGNAYQAEFSFDPSRPTSLLYRPTAGGFELIGAMYTAPVRFTESELDERVPLSVAAWHQHVNICLPPESRHATADWRRFGFGGSIATADACQQEGGNFHPVIFNWMVHVYPFEKDQASIWSVSRQHGDAD
jgi:hypothetical protein